MTSEELSLLARWSGDLEGLLQAGGQCDLVAAALLRLLPGAVAAHCHLDGVNGSTGQKLPQTETLTAEVESAGRVRGALTVAVEPKTRDVCASLLSLAARLVALRLPPEPADQRHLQDLVTVGEAAGWLVHALNNHLNGMVLQAACVQMQTQGPVREQAEYIRREGARAAVRLRPLQAMRPWPAREGETVDLLAMIRLVLRDEAGFASIQAHLPAEEMRVAASVPGMRRLLALLFRVAQRCSGSGERITVRPQRGEGYLELAISLPGVQLQEDGEGLDALPPEPEGGLHQLEREAARWLGRQMGGQWAVAQTTEGATLTLRWETVRSG
jgi:hypothetical protein